MGHLIPELRDYCYPVSEQVMALKCNKPIWQEKGFVWHNVAHYIIQRNKDDVVIVGGGRSTLDGSNRPFVDHGEVEFLGTGLGGMIRANDSSVYPVLHTDIRQFLRSHFPNEAWPEYEEAEWAGVQGYTKDHLPYIGPLPHHPTQYIAAGYNGHGTYDKAKRRKNQCDCRCGDGR
jgi:glycine/D-amino acid oxidase-like deaminating enzyme